MYTCIKYNIDIQDFKFNLKSGKTIHICKHFFLLFFGKLEDCIPTFQTLSHFMKIENGSWSQAKFGQVLPSRRVFLIYRDVFDNHPFSTVNMPGKHAWHKSHVI